MRSQWQSGFGVMQRNVEFTVTVSLKPRRSSCFSSRLHPMRKRQNEILSR
jgi:hypothetical protein